MGFRGSWVWLDLGLWALGAALGAVLGVGIWVGKARSNLAGGDDFSEGKVYGDLL